MAKKKKNNISIKDILKGKFLVEEGSAQNWNFVLFLVVLAFISISSSHWLDRKTIKIYDLKVEVAELKSKYADVHNELMNNKLERNIAARVIHDSIKPSSQQPLKIIAKPND